MGSEVAMTDEIIYGLMDVFKQVDNQPLTLREITRRMQAQGFYRDVDLNKAAVDVRLHLDDPRFISCALGTIERGTFQRKKRQDETVSLLQIGEEIQRTISDDGSEISNEIIPLRGQEDRFFASMDIHQQRQRSIDIRYYADENKTCKIEQDDLEHYFLKGEWLKNWYKENRIEPGDKIYLVVENVIPLAIRIYTKWERNPDAYRRYKLLQESNPFPSVNLPIWYLIGEFFEKTGEIAHRLDIGKDIIEKRPEISEQSVYSCLSKEKYLFVRVRDSYWGLKEWNLEEVTRTIRPAGSSLEENPNSPTEIVSLGEILADIASENLVYRILEESPTSLTVDEITERISKYFGVSKGVLSRATFFDPSDPRFYRQEDGTFTLRENLEEVIHHLSENERTLKISLEDKIQKLQETTESLTAQHKKEANQLKEEQDILKKLAGEWIEQIEHYEKINNQREKRIQLMSEFLAEAVPHIRQDRLNEIFEHLHRKSELRNIIDSDEIIKFSKIVHKFLPRSQN